MKALFQLKASHLRHIPTIAVAACLASTVSATVFLADPAPTGTDAYTANGKVYGKNPTLSSVIGFSTAWSGYDTSVIKLPSSSSPLAYPSATALIPSGSSFVVASNIGSEGRLVQRAIPAANLPTKGTIYVSMLMKASSATLYNAYPTAATFYGLGRNLRNTHAGEAANSDAVNTFPVDGVYFGFTKSGLVLCVEGTWHTLVPTITANATYFCVAKIELDAEGTKERVSAVVNPAVSALEPTAWDASCIADIVDTGSPFSYLNLGGAIPGTLYFDELIVAESWIHAAYMPATIQFSDADTTTSNDIANAQLDFSAKLSSTTPSNALFVCFGPVDGGPNTNEWSVVVPWQSPAAAGVAYATSVSLSSLATNTIYAYAAVASDGVDGDEAFFGTFMTGEVSAALKNDAVEQGLVPGVWTISRPASATNLNLTVNYALSSPDAVAGVHYVDDLSGSVIIPKGQTSVDLVLTPMLAAYNADLTVTLTLSPGNYFLGAVAPVAMLIDNYDTPTDRHVWSAPAAGNASEASNWSTGTVPGPGDDIYLAHFSTADMTWDAGVNGLPATVKSWNQAASYTGNVIFPINFPTVAGATFTNFTITGAAVIDGGNWTHPPSLTRSSGAALTPAQLQANQQYRLCATIGTTLTVGPAGRIDASGKGYFHNAAVNIYPAHGGRFSSSSSVAAYGDVKFPQDIGFAANQGTDAPTSKRAAGGGAILLSVGDAATVDGVVSVNGEIKSLSVGAGGSIVLKAKSLAGTGDILAEGPAASGTTSTSGTGGRIAVITDTPVDIAAPTLSASVFGRTGCGGCGTIYLKDASMTEGVLVVRDLLNTSQVNPITTCTPVVAEGDWTFDSVVLGGMVRLTVPAGTTLSLPGGLASVSSTDTALRDSILYQGGTLDIGSPATHIVQGNWVFGAVSPFTFNGDVLVRDGGAIGLSYLAQTMSPASALTMTLLVNGDLEIASTGAIIGTEGGAMIDSNLVPAGFGIASHGGRYQAGSTTYDSILHPVYPGLGQYNSYSWMRAGAAINLTVTGELTLDGIAQSDGWNAAGGGPHGSAGTLNFTLGSLSGNGSISAKGTTANAGGRIAIRLTDPGATFDAFGIGDISAHGYSTCSAGTAYLETAADGEDAGLIIVKNNNSTSTMSTPIPATGAMADDPATLKNTSLVVADKARVDLSASLFLKSASLASGTVLDLAGKTFTVRGMTAGGAKIASGIYAAGSALFTDGYVVDSVGGGQVVVLGAGTVIVVR